MPPPDPPTRISIGSSVTSRSGRSRRPEPSHAPTRTAVVGRRMASVGTGRGYRGSRIPNRSSVGRVVHVVERRRGEPVDPAHLIPGQRLDQCAQRPLPTREEAGRPRQCILRVAGADVLLPAVAVARDHRLRSWCVRERRDGGRREGQITGQEHDAVACVAQRVPRHRPPARPAVPIRPTPPAPRGVPRPRRRPRPSPGSVA